MCNLYRQDVIQSDITHFLNKSSLSLSEQARSRNVESGFVGADQDGPLLVNADEAGHLNIVTKRWGFPAIRDKAKPITNIRNLKSSWWRGANREYLFESEYRCLVPFSAFAEWNSEKKENAWFEIDAPCPVFAGVWRPWTGERLKPVAGKTRRQRARDDWKLFAFLTTEPNDVVAAVHPKAMPVILTRPEEWELWMQGGEDSLSLQRPLPLELTQQRS